MSETTGQQIAGEALDREIAVKVMGIVPREVRVRGSTERVTVWTGNPALSDGVWDAYQLVRYGEPRPFSTDIATAWTVVERMSNLGWHARVESPFEAGQPYFAGFTPHGMSGWNGVPDHQAGAYCAAEAICRAALAALQAVSSSPLPGD